MIHLKAQLRKDLLPSSCEYWQNLFWAVGLRTLGLCWLPVSGCSPYLACGLLHKAAQQATWQLVSSEPTRDRVQQQDWTQNRMQLIHKSDIPSPLRYSTGYKQATSSAYTQEEGMAEEHEYQKEGIIGGHLEANQLHSSFHFLPLLKIPFVHTLWVKISTVYTNAALRKVSEDAGVGREHVYSLVTLYFSLQNPNYILLL